MGFGRFDRFFGLLASARQGGKTEVDVLTDEVASRLGLPGFLLTLTATKLANANQVQVITIDADAGTFTLTYIDQTTSALAFDADAATVQTALRALSNIGATDVTVSGSAGGPWTVTAANTFVATDLDMLVLDPALLLLDGSVAIATVTGGTHTAAEADTQTVTVKASGGTFTLTYAGQTTAAIAYNATAAVLLTALEALSNIAPGDLSVSGGPGDINESFPYTITFLADGTLADDEAAFTGSGASLTGAGAALTLGQLLVGIATSTSVNEVQSVTVTAASGTFTLTYSGQTSAAIDFDATAAEVQSALEALSNIAAGDVIVSGAAGGPYRVEFSGTLRYTNVAAMTASGASLVGVVGTGTVEETTKGTTVGSNIDIAIQVPDADGTFADYVAQAAALTDTGTYQWLIHPNATAAGGVDVSTLAMPPSFKVKVSVTGHFTIGLSGQVMG